MVIYFFLAGSVIFVNSVDYTFNNILQPHQKDRVNILLGLKSDPHGTGYNVNQSIISIGSGGFTGKGFLQGTQTKFKFVPEQSSDFIFCTVGEEWGFLGSFVVIGIYLFSAFATYFSGRTAAIGLFKDIWIWSCINHFYPFLYKYWNGNWTGSGNRNSLAIF